nr:MAG TPA: hypothetical protein [Caudoviricetes sp.]
MENKEGYSPTCKRVGECFLFYIIVYFGYILFT